MSLHEIRATIERAIDAAVERGVPLERVETVIREAAAKVPGAPQEFVGQLLPYARAQAAKHARVTDLEKRIADLESQLSPEQKRARLSVAARRY